MFALIPPVYPPHPSSPPPSSSLPSSPASEQDKGFMCQVECVTQASALKQSTGNGERQRRRNRGKEMCAEKKWSETGGWI